MDSARLQLNHPHVIVSIEIPDASIKEVRAKENGVLSLNYRKLFKKLTGRKRRDEGNKQVDKEVIASPMVPPDTVPDLSLIGKKSSNRFTNIIDHLERKYTSLATKTATGDIIEEEGASEGSQSNHNSNATSPAAPSSPTSNGKAKRVKKRKVFDDYDYADGFIDDTEAVIQVVGALESKKMKTKHDGFFVSTGELQLEPAKKVPKAPPSNPTSSSSKAPEERNKAAPETKRDDPSEKPAAGKKAKPWWSPAPQVQAALEALRGAREGMRGKITKKNPIPRALNPDIFAYHQAVKQHHSTKELNQTSGFIESLQEVLGGEGGELSPLKIRYLLNKLDLQETARLEKEKVEAMVEKLMQGLKGVVIPCPESKQPGYKQKKSGGKDNLPGEEAGENVEHVAENTEKKSGEDSALPPLSLASLSQPPSQPLAHPSLPKENTDQAEPAASSDALPRFAFYCKWTVPLRQEVVALEEGVAQWVQAENKHREKLTNQDKAEMEENEYWGLNSKDELDRLFVKIAKIFPDSCLQGDLLGIKNAMKAERARVASQKKKEAKALEQANNTSSSTNINSSSNNNNNSAAVDPPAPLSPPPVYSAAPPPTLSPAPPQANEL